MNEHSVTPIIVEDEVPKNARDFHFFVSSFFFSLPPEALREKTDMTTFATIMDKLKQNPMYPNYIRHVNGDTLDNRPENLQFVHIRDAFSNINDWKVDWILDVTNEERCILVDILTTTPEVYHYFRWRAERHPDETNQEDVSTPRHWKNIVNRTGPRTCIAGVGFDNEGRVLEDFANPEFLEEFRAQ